MLKRDPESRITLWQDPWKNFEGDDTESVGLRRRFNKVMEDLEALALKEEKVSQDERKVIKEWDTKGTFLEAYSLAAVVGGSEGRGSCREDS